MVEKKNLKEIIEMVRKDFSFLKDKVKGVLLFGSACGNTKAARDIDICIIAPKIDEKNLLKEIFRRVNVNKKKMEIIKNHIIIYGNAPEIGEYFYFYRKLWNDQKHRQKLTKKEKMKILGE